MNIIGDIPPITVNEPINLNITFTDPNVPAPTSLSENADTLNISDVSVGNNTPSEDIVNNED